MPRVKLTFASGDVQRYDAELAAHTNLVKWLESTGSVSYGLPQTLNELDDVGKETLESLYPNESNQPLQFSPPPTLSLPSLIIDLCSTTPKATANFLALAASNPSHKSRVRPNPILSYTSEQGRKVFRLESDFVLQTGDVTRGDGSGGESIYGGDGKFADEKDGLKRAFVWGSVGMASSGKNTNTSQFFITLARTPASLKKLTGKYVNFGQIDTTVASQADCLESLNALSRIDGPRGSDQGSQNPIWIAGLEVLQE